MTAIYLDRRIDNDFAGVSPSYDGFKTIWTLPYSVATNGSEGTVSVVRKDTLAALTVTRPSATTVAVTGSTLVAVDVWIGITYGFRAELSVIYKRDQNSGAPDVRGRTTLRYLKLFYEDATSFIVTVTSSGRAARTYTFTAADLTVAESGIFTVPIQSRNTETTIVITSPSAGAAGFSGYEWEGTVYRRVPRG